MIFEFFKKHSFKPRTDIRCKNNLNSNYYKSKSFKKSGEIYCCLCDLKQVALPSAVPLRDALLNRLRGQNIGEYPFSVSPVPGVSLRSCVPLYCRSCGKVICFECEKKHKLGGKCPECGTSLKYVVR